MKKFDLLSLFCTAFPAVFWLSSCSAPPLRQKPVAKAVPAGWVETAALEPGLRLGSLWWKIFNDPVLNALEERALAESPSVAKAIARVDEARALAGVVASDRALNISLDPSVNNARASKNDKMPPGFPIYTTRFRAAVDAGYEVDAWGRVKNNIAAARQDAAAVEADEAAVRLTLTGDVARAYYQLRTLEAQVDVLKRTSTLRENAAKVEQARVDAGLINELSVSRSRLEIATTQSILASVERQAAELRHALAVLTGRPPAAVGPIDVVFLAIPPAVPVDLPSEVLKRRPDVQAADSAINAAFFRLGAARAAFFPQIKLTGSLGLESADLINLLDLSSRVWSIGPSVTLPLLDGRRNEANYRVAEARLQQTVADYQSKVLGVFREVEDALSDLQWLARQSSSVESALDAAKQVSLLSRERYDKGLTNYLDTVDAERAVLDAELSHVQLNGLRFAATVALAKSLGGGWVRGADSLAIGD